jgi:hypothetical protein
MQALEILKNQHIQISAAIDQKAPCRKRSPLGFLANEAVDWPSNQLRVTEKISAMGQIYPVNHNCLITIRDEN